MAIHYAAAILYLYPNAVPDVDFRIEDHSNDLGPQITLWNETAIGGPQPTEQELQDASDAAEALQTQENSRKVSDKINFDNIDYASISTMNTNQLRGVVQAMYKIVHRLKQNHGL
jgi:hypothetical protein